LQLLKALGLATPQAGGPVDAQGVRRERELKRRTQAMEEAEMRRKEFYGGIRRSLRAGGVGVEGEEVVG
jgi:hypothetical protein